MTKTSMVGGFFSVITDLSVELNDVCDNLSL